MTVQMLKNSISWHHNPPSPFHVMLLTMSFSADNESVMSYNNRSSFYGGNGYGSTSRRDFQSLLSFFFVLR